MEEVRKEQEAKAEGAAKLPVVEVLQKAWRTVLIGVFALATATGGYYVVTSFLLSYGTGDLHLSESMLLNGLTLAAFLELLVTPWLSWLADRVGPRHACAGSAHRRPASRRRTRPGRRYRPPRKGLRPRCVLDRPDGLASQARPAVEDTTATGRTGRAVRPRH
ncbi:hypothetical protein ACFYPZ_29100 [Streptomyces sp. NPDC005506]|uniref:hypothetical protein n=1 Tax=Streptomyces sp. NPDC005506 TaxID=3364718 RepID=UPI0036A8F0A0